MQTRNEPVIFAVDLDETLYNSQAEGIEYLVNMKEFFNAIKYAAHALEQINKKVYLHIITAKTREDDIVHDIRTQALLHLNNPKLDVHCVGNSGNAEDVAVRKIQKMAELSLKHNTSPQNFIFIDDNACNIEKAMSQDVLCIHAHNKFNQNKENIEMQVATRTKILVSEISACVKVLISKNRYFPIMPFFKNNEYNQPFDKYFATSTNNNSCKK